MTDDTMRRAVEAGARRRGSDLFRYEQYERERRERMEAIVLECADRTSAKIAATFRANGVKFVVRARLAEMLGET